MESNFSKHILAPFAQSISVHSLSPALNIAGTTYTYLQLSHRIAAIRQALRQHDASDKIAALAIHDDIDTYASIFALWMEGKAYVPLHPNQPLERNQGIIGQVGTRLILDSADTSPFDALNTSRFNSTDNSPLLTDWVPTDDNQLAYILFTSGSTGVPKGVTISRRNIAAFIDSFWQTGINIDHTDRCLQAFDLTFDVSVQSFLVALTRGACLYTVPYGMVKYLYVAQLIQDQHITFGAMAPSMLTYLRPYFDELDATSLRACILTAEACPTDLMEDWFHCATNTDIYDFYGPTEATIYCTYYKLSRQAVNLSENGIISIGRPLADIHALILSDDGNPVSGQEKGELCISGDQVTPGYWNNPDKNAEAFFEREDDGVVRRYYHTGDLCYRHPSGNIMYCGRIDQQAKIQGFRVELGEIEYHAREFYNRQHRVVAIAFQNASSLTEIALFVESPDQDSAPLLAYLRSKLPGYMVPTRVLYRVSFPLNASDKINRTQLKSEIQ
ncbi:MAG: amino acid adenylation domain-containing protein [Bacteroidales bacterium]|nr:amino acid adenylation domain-containing protein [Bacteroidales bacterium]